MMLSQQLVRLARRPFEQGVELAVGHRQAGAVVEIVQVQVEGTVRFEVLPPVIYASAVAMSWREFRFNLRPISLLAVGCVVFTTIAVAAAAHFVLGLAWPVGFV